MPCFTVCFTQCFPCRRQRGQHGIIRGEMRQRLQRPHGRFDRRKPCGTPLTGSAPGTHQRAVHQRGHSSPYICRAGSQRHLAFRHSLGTQSGKLHKREQSLHESLVLQRTGDRRIPHRHAISAQSFAEQPHGGIVVGDDRHVVPPNMPVEMRPLDAPDHIIQLLT